MAQAVEIDVGAAGNGYQCLALHAVALNVDFQAGQRQGAGRFHDAAGIVENIFNSAAYGISIDGDDFVEQVAAEAEGFVSDDFYGGAV